MNDVYGVKLIAIGLESYFRPWAMKGGSVIWGGFFHTKSEAEEKAKNLSL